MASYDQILDRALNDPAFALTAADRARIREERAVRVLDLGRASRA